MFSDDEKRYKNDTHKQWVQNSATQAVIKRLKELPRPDARKVRSVDTEKEFQAQAMFQSGIDYALSIIEIPPYPAIEGK